MSYPKPTYKPPLLYTVREYHQILEQAYIIARMQSFEDCRILTKALAIYHPTSAFSIWHGGKEVER